MAKVTKTLLKSIVDGTRSATGYTMVDEKHVEELVKAGHAEVNTEIKKDGQVAARASQTLLAQYPVEMPAKQAFQIDNGLVPPAAKRTGLKEEIYPFSQLQVGQSFFIPATEANKNPATTFASTVSSATRRFAEKHATQTRVNRKGETVPVLVPSRKFTIRAVKAGQKYDNGFVEKQDGARVFRIQ